MGKCLLCSDDLPDYAIIDHIRVMHPDEYGDGPEKWPDGAPVIVDQTEYTADDVAGGAT